MESYALPVELYGFFLIFARVGAMIMLLPGVGESAVPPPVRLGLAFLLSLVLYPVVKTTLPPIPEALDGLVGALVIQLLIGLALGSVIKFFMSTLILTGEVISLQTTLAFSQTTNPTESQPAATVGSFLTVVGLALIFSTNLHQLFIGAIAKSFTLFQPGRPAPLGDFVSLGVRTVGDTFALGVQLAAPLLVFGLIFNFAAGLIGRVMPGFQIFFAAAPLTLLFGLSLLALSLGMMGLVWLDRFRTFAVQLS